MALPGPVPMPTALKQMLGEKDINRQEPRPTEVKATPPRSLTDKAARKLYKTLATELVRFGLLTRIERRWNDRLFTRISGTPFVSELVFHHTGRPVGDFRKAWKRACKAAGVPERTFHDLRRSYARNAEMAGVPRSVAMATGGWKTDATYSRYNIVDVTRLRQGARAMQLYVDTLPTSRPISGPSSSSI